MGQKLEYHHKLSVFSGVVVVNSESMTNETMKNTFVEHDGAAWAEMGRELNVIIQPVYMCFVDRGKAYVP